MFYYPTGGDKFMTTVRIFEVYEDGTQKSRIARVTEKQLDAVRTFILFEGGSEIRTDTRNKGIFQVPAPCMLPFIKQIEQKWSSIKFVDMRGSKYSLSK